VISPHSRRGASDARAEYLQGRVRVCALLGDPLRAFVSLP
jgi:hypothetical protein